MDPSRVSDITARSADFRRALDTDDPVVEDLAIGISRALQPDLDVIGVLAALDELAGDCPTPTRDGVMNHLFGSGMFEGDHADYHSWQNSCVDRVIASRRGMPITLAVIAVSVAARLGVEVAVVGLPGHVVVGDPADPEWFADPFHGRTGLDRDDCRALVASVRGVRWSERAAEPLPPRFVAARILNNLGVSCRRRNDTVRAALVSELRRSIPELGDDHDGLWLALAPLN